MIELSATQPERPNTSDRTLAHYARTAAALSFDKDDLS